MRKYIVNFVVFLVGLMALTIYIHTIDPLLGDRLGPIFGAIVLPIFVGVVGSIVFSGSVTARAALCGSIFPGAVFVSWLLNAGESRDPESGVFVVLVALWTGALAAIAVWIMSARTRT